MGTESLSINHEQNNFYSQGLSEVQQTFQENKILLDNLTLEDLTSYLDTAYQTADLNLKVTTREEIPELTEEQRHLQKVINSLGKLIDVTGLSHQQIFDIIKNIQELLNSNQANRDNLVSILSQHFDIPNNYDLNEIKFDSNDPEKQMIFILENVITGRGHCQIETLPLINYSIYDILTEPNFWIDFGIDEAEVEIITNIFIKMIEITQKNLIIIDGFDQDHGITDRTGRRGWRQRMTGIFGDHFKNLYSKNRLKWNIFIEISQQAMYLDSLRNTNFPASLNNLINHCYYLTDNGVNWYNELSIEEKIEEVKKINHLIIASLEELIKLSPHI